MKNYKLLKNPYGGEPVIVKKLPELTCIPFDEQNMEYQEYLKWLEEGNTPEPADE